MLRLCLGARLRRCLEQPQCAIFTMVNQLNPDFNLNATAQDFTLRFTSTMSQCAGTGFAVLVLSIGPQGAAVSY